MNDRSRICYLDTAEFVYLLAMFSATRIVGLPAECLAPAAGESRDDQYARGLGLLKEHGWVTPARQEGSWEIDPGLVLMGVTAADPLVVLVASRARAAGGRQHLMYGLHWELAVEVFQQRQDRFRLQRVRRYEEAAAGIAAFLSLPAPLDHPVAHVIGEKALAGALDLAARGDMVAGQELLLRQALDSRGIAEFLSATSPPESRHEIRLYLVRGGRIQDQAEMLYFHATPRSWLVGTAEPGSTLVRVTTADAPTLTAAVKQRIDAWKPRLPSPVQ